MTISRKIQIVLDLYNDPTIKKQAIPFILKKTYLELFEEINNIGFVSIFSAKAYCFINHITENPKCHCGKQTNYVSMTNGFSKTCSCKCMGTIEETKIKRKETTLEKYGVENISTVTRDQIREKYWGKTDEERQEIKDKRRQTNLENFGVTNPLKSESIKKQWRQTNLEKYGVEYPTQSSAIRQTMKNNNMEKYGVESISQIAEIQDKKVTTGFKRKKYIWKTGEISIVQGYENIILRELEENGYTVEQVITDSKDMPQFWYYYQDKKKRYFPDIYIPKEKLVIEVKSNYTNSCNEEINQLKFQSVIDNGYDFRLEVRQ